MELSYRCGACGKDSDFAIFSSEVGGVTITCGCGRSVKHTNLDGAWKAVSESPQPPAPTLIDAHSIPCQEERVSHLWVPTGAQTAKCGYCGVEVRDEV